MLRAAPGCPGSAVIVHPSPVLLPHRRAPWSSCRRSLAGPCRAALPSAAPAGSVLSSEAGDRALLGTAVGTLA